MQLRRILFFGFGGLAAAGVASPPAALAAGLGLALVLGNPFPAPSHRLARILLQGSVVGLGFGMNLGIVWEVGRSGLLFSAATITGALAVGLLLGRLLCVERQTSLLISAGTAICGGSAISAVGSAIDADNRALSVSLATVFVLNAVARFVFPPLGHALGLGQREFGVWCAVAIHDTSSVVGAAAHYGNVALQTATTVKLVRALGIVPLVAGVSLVRHGRMSLRSYPWFILLFLLAVTVSTAVPRGEPVFTILVAAAKLGLGLTLFLIGAGLSRDALRDVGARPLVQGVALWLLVGLVSLMAVHHAFA